MVNKDIKQYGMLPFYCTRQWFACLKETTVRDCPLFELQLERHALPHVVEKKSFFLIPLKTLRSLSNYYTPEFDIADKHYNDISAAYSSEVKQFCAVELHPLSEKNALAVSAKLKTLGFYVSIFETTDNWFHDQITSSEQYWQARPSILINTLNRKITKAEKIKKYRLAIYSEHDDARLELYLTDFHNVYNKSWKVTEPFPDFINNIARYESVRGNLRIGVVYHDSLAVAAQIWFKFENTAYIFKLAYDNQYKKEGYGNILTQALINFSITEDGITKIDFLTGSDSYKKDWMNNSRKLYSLVAFNKRTWSGSLVICLFKIKLLIKQILQPGVR